MQDIPKETLIKAQEDGGGGHMPQGGGRRGSRHGGMSSGMGQGMHPGESFQFWATITPSSGSF